ncbi:MAG: cyclase family protein [bacterium]|nr:cyclase family protein [bacterium]
MAIHDITLPLHEGHPPWPGDTPYERIQLSDMSEGAKCNVSKIEMSTHFATHLDAPFHFEPDGIRVDQLDLETLIGPVLVHEAGASDLIEPEHLPSLEGVERIIFKTRNLKFIASKNFNTEYVALSHEGARALTGAGVKLVGIDYFSIEAYRNPGNPVHHELCGKGVIIVEGLDLRGVAPGWYDLTVLPLKLKGSDGSPCRAILRDPA